MKEKLELEIGIPVTVTFAYDTGKLCQKRFPGAEDTYARQTNDGRVLFVDAADEMRLRKSARGGHPIIICRCQTKSGARYLTIKTPSPEVKHPLGVVDGGVRSIPESKYAAPETEWTGMTVSAPVTQSGDGGLLGRCLCEALDACKVAQAHAATIGLPTVFGAGEIERMAVSIFIERTRTGAVTERKPAARQEGTQRINGVTH